MTLDIKIRKTLPGFELNIDLSCEVGITGILGQSGSGKSMLLNCLAGLVKPDEGFIRIGEKTLFDSEKKINVPTRERRIGFLFQNYALFPHMTILENVAFGITGFTKRQKLDKAVDLLERFHILDLKNRYPSQISGGQQQRVALARAMAVDPEIFLLDEPFSALDHHLKLLMMKDMAETLESYGGYAMFVTHNIDEAYQLCKSIAVINDGNVDAFGTKQIIFKQPSSRQNALVTGCTNIAAAKRVSEQKVYIEEWDIEMQPQNLVIEESAYVGFRPNDISLANSSLAENSYKVWVADEAHSPTYSTFYLKFGKTPDGKDDYHIQWMISNNEREKIVNTSYPLYIRINPENIFCLSEKAKS